MRMPPRLAAALATTALALLAAAPAAAAEPDETVGGPDLAASGVVVAPDAPALPDVGAASWVLADLDTGEVLAAKDPHGRYAPASALKTLTAVTLIPVLDRDLKVAATFDDVNVEGSKVGIVERVGYPVHELFAALLMVSGNDAANVLASAAGGQDKTAELMNAKAQQLQALDTVAVNPHGLDAQGQQSSAYDLALIARAGLADPQFTAYASTLNATVSAPGGARIDIRNKNKMLKSYPGTIGGKNGFTSTARASYVGAAERDGRRLVVALMKSVPRVFDEAAKLLDWGFASAGVQPVGTLVAPIGEAPPEQASVPVQGVTEGPATGVGGASRPVEQGTGLPVTLAGTGLAAASLLVVRPGGRLHDSRRPVPAAARPPVQRRPEQRRPVQRRPVPRTVAARTPARTPARRW